MGHPNYHAANRAWPSGQEVVIDVLDQDDDPMTEGKGSDGEMHTYPHPTQVGRTSFAKLRADKMLMVRLVGGTPEEAETMQEKVAQLQASLAAITCRAELAEREVVRLQAKANELEAQLDEATSPASPPVVPGHSAAPSADDLPVEHPAHKQAVHHDHPAHGGHKR